MGSQDAKQPRDLAGLGALLRFLGRAVQDGTQVAIAKAVDQELGAADSFQQCRILFA